MLVAYHFQEEFCPPLAKGTAKAHFEAVRGKLKEFCEGEGEINSSLPSLLRGVAHGL